MDDSSFESLWGHNDLAAIACDAVTSIQNQIGGKAMDYVPVNRLARMFERKIEEAGGLDSAYLFSKSLEKYTADIKCVKDDSGDISDGDEILLRRNLFVRELRDIRNLSRGRLENLRDFCIELFNWALADSDGYVPRFAA